MANPVRRKPRLFKFWVEMQSGNQMATEYMTEEEAIAWLRTCNQKLVAMQIVESMTRQEALAHIVKGNDDDI